MEFEPMSPDDMQRTMQFLLAQQARFAADIDKLSLKTDRLTDALVTLTGMVGRVAEAQLQTDEQLRRTDEQLQRTDERLNAVITLFERHLRDEDRHRPS